MSVHGFSRLGATAAAMVSPINSPTKKNRRAQIRENRFNDFATVYQDKGTSIQRYMTATDFLNSLTVQDIKNQSYEAAVELDTYSKQYFHSHDLSAKLYQLNTSYERHGSIQNPLTTFAEQALLSYYDYVILLTILSKSEEHFDLAFQLLDKNGDGKIELEEYREFEQFFIDTSSSSTLMDEIVGGYPTLLKLFFFGQDSTQEIDFQKFSAFARGLHLEILEHEYQDLKSNDDIPGSPDTISAKSFAVAVLRNTRLPPDKVEERVERVHQLFNDTRVTFKEFIDFHDFLRSLDDFAKGLQFLEQQEHTIGPEEFARAMRITTGVQLRDTLVSVVYSIFDVNGDGHLSHKEVMSIMKSRLDRAMRAHMDDNKLSFRRCILVTGAQLRLSGTE